jgi:hypothetical protein
MDPLTRSPGKFNAWLYCLFMEWGDRLAKVPRLKGDRTPAISSSDRASFPAGFLGQRLGQFFAQTIAAIADLLKLDSFFSDPCDRPIKWKKSTAIAFSLVMVAISFANASK